MSDTKKKILVVEDERTLAESVQRYLTEEGFEVETAFDGEEGLRKARDFNPDLILMDVIMPKLDGLSALKILKLDPNTKNIPVVILTNLGTDQAIQEALESGSTEYLVKVNYSLEDLTEKIKNLLG